MSNDREAWTNVEVDGTAYQTDPSLTCANWTSGSGGQSGRVGETDTVDSDWTSSHSDPCNSTWRLYCVQQD